MSSFHLKEQESKLIIVEHHISIWRKFGYVITWIKELLLQTANELKLFIRGKNNTKDLTSVLEELIKKKKNPSV